MAMLKNLFRALAKLPQIVGELSQPKSNPKLVMTLLVKDEADIIAQNLHFHRAMGVDAFVVTDNQSTDGTREILQRYVECGWIVRLIDEPAVAYEQKRWVDRMVRIAADELAADWVINADADEFWFSPTHSLKSPIRSRRKTKLRCVVQNMRPEEGIPLTEWTEAAIEVPQPQQHGLSPFSIFSRATHKVMHRTLGYLKISMGNHKATMLPNLSAESDVVVYHFNVRSLAHFRRKVENGGRSISLLSKASAGRHWRYFYAQLQAGNLESEYRKVVGTDRLEALRSQGYIQRDTRLRDFFEQHPEAICSDAPPPPPQASCQAPSS